MVLDHLNLLFDHRTLFIRAHRVYVTDLKFSEVFITSKNINNWSNGIQFHRCRDITPQCTYALFEYLLAVRSSSPIYVCPLFIWHFFFAIEQKEICITPFIASNQTHSVYAFFYKHKTEMNSLHCCHLAS